MQSLKIIQIMSSIVAAAAFRELGMYSCCVRQIVTIATQRNSFVCVGVAAYASDIMMQGFACHKLVIGIFVTCSTENVLCAVRIIEKHRLVNLVAGCAVVVAHLLSVGFVADGALRNCPVGICMTEVTGNLGMCARVCNQLFVLLGVAG